METNRIRANQIRPAIHITEGKIYYILGNTEDNFPATTKQDIVFAAQEIARDLARMSYRGEVIIHGGNKTYYKGEIIEKDIQVKEEPIQEIIDAFNKSRQQYN